MKDQTRKAEEFRELHRGKKLLILPNAWDVPSARVFEDGGFPAIATSSAGIMVSLGYPDGEVIERKEFVSATQRIARALSVPWRPSSSPHRSHGPASFVRSEFAEVGRTS